VMMPGMDGFDTCRHLKQNLATQDIPVIFMTAMADTADKVKGFQVGAVDYITKPIQQDELLARLTTHLSLKRKSDLLLKLASLDSLTEIPNRRAFDLALNNGWRSSMKSGEPLSVVMLDVDMFKQYNDHYGHSAGDLCLHRIAQALSGSVRRSVDVVARYGGEEFAVVLPETDLAGSVTIAEELRALIKEHGFEFEGEHIPVSASIGCAELADGHDGVKLIKAADLKLYDAKRAGRNRVCS
jgi:diguanylate cyclase (GGDEF)-like protein